MSKHPFGLSGRIAAPILIGFISVVLLGGCATGPDFNRPDVPQVTSYTKSPLPAQTASSPTELGEAQHFLPEASIDERWWQEWGSSELDGLVELALQTSPTLAAAQGRLRQAEENYDAHAGSTLYPRIDGGLSGQRQRFNPAALGQSGNAREFNLYNASAGVHYNFDLAGGNRRALEALTARIDYQRFQLEGARLTLAANIMITAVSQAQFADQLQASEAILQAQEEQLDLTRELVLLGIATPDDVLALQTQVEQTRAAIPALRSQREKAGHLLAVLSGKQPGMHDLPSFSLEDFTLPVDLPLVLPSELVRRRPDIQASEALLHAANAEYGVAVSELYPQFNLSANIGSQALTAGSLFGSGSLIWGLVGQLTQPLFNPGLPAKKRAALAAFEAAAANYQGVVLESLRSVADVLVAIDSGAQILAAQAAADKSAQAALESMQQKHALGAASYLQLLIAQQQAQQTSIDLIAAKAQRLIDSVTLYQAMGGGVRNSDTPAGIALTRTARD